MVFRPRGVLGVFALATLLAASVSPASSSNSPPASGSSGPSLKVAAAPTASTARKRRVRRGPPGGVVYSRNAVVIDPLTNEVLFEKNAGRSVPIASITKLMTAIVFVGLNVDLSRQVEVRRDDLIGGGKTQLRSRERVALGDLLHMSLMCSDNVATRVMVRESGIPRQEYLSRMNRKALELGLTETRFVEFTGLDPANVSSATDVARMLRAASDHDMIRSISTTRTYEFRSSRRPHFVANTNRMLVRPLRNPGRQDRLHQLGRLLPRHLGACRRPRPDRGGPRRTDQRDPFRRRRAHGAEDHGSSARDPQLVLLRADCRGRTARPTDPKP